jgi:aspartyl-tRNA(Asn)/glutamyl-tRNA(Gln) amidotransferase subunit A
MMAPAPFPSAGSIAAAVRAGDVSAEQMCQDALSRIKAVDPDVRAFCTVVPEIALKAARAVDARCERGEDPGVLAGVPVAVKDLISTAGLRTTFGSWHYRDFVPPEDDVAVARLRACGAVIIGKTTSSEFGYSALGTNQLFPTPRNPHDLSRITGGSSAGSGAAVASGAVPLALGSDGGGSVRIPASLCGVVGFKPSMGRIPVWPGCKDDRLPGVSSWDTLEHIGPLATSVADIWLAMRAMTGPDPHDRFSLPGNPFTGSVEQGWLTGRTVGLSVDFGFIAVDDEVRACVEQVAERLEADFGCVVRRIDPSIGDISDVFPALIAADTDLDGMRALARERPFANYVMWLLSHEWQASDLTNARRARQRVCRLLADYMADVDLLITPTSPVAAFSLEASESVGRWPDAGVPPNWLGLCNPMNLTGQPAISLPAGATAAGLPIGIQLVGRHLADVDVLGAALDLEQALPSVQITVSSRARGPSEERNQNAQ